MNPGLVVKLRPSGPWRIGPDSGARNRVDVIYHSDSLYSAVTSAMARMGKLEEWLDATARSSAPAVCFGSCFPFVDEIGFIVPPRTVWPPAAPSLMAARVRWKSARFVPLTMVQAILAGDRLDENRWMVDGESGCLMPAGRPGPFRASVRWSAAVDRLSGASERHSTACIEFRSGAGLWTVAGFADEAARDHWQDIVKAAFRLLADSGFGGERSRGWGRAESPEFIEGELPSMIIGGRETGDGRRDVVVSPAPELSPEEELVSGSAEVLAPPSIEPLESSAGDAEPDEPSSEENAVSDSAEVLARSAAGPLEAAAGDPQAEEASVENPAGEQTVESSSEEEVSGSVESPATLGVEPNELPVAEPEPADESQSESGAELTLTPESPAPGPRLPAPAAPLSPVPRPLPPAPGTPHWLLSLFTPAESDTVDWGRGSYTVLARGGRVDSPAGSGALKKQVRMIAEGSVLVAGSAPRGAATDVAPDGFAHPVFRAGFALVIPLPEGN